MTLREMTIIEEIVRAAWARNDRSDMDILEKTKAKYVAPIDQIELACRMLEAAGKLTRPPGLTAMQSFMLLDKEDQEAWLAASAAAMLYWKECIADANRADQ